MSAILREPLAELVFRLVAVAAVRVELPQYLTCRVAKDPEASFFDLDPPALRVVGRRGAIGVIEQPVAELWT